MALMPELTLPMKIFGLFIIPLFLRIRISHALDCHECGSLSIIPGGTNKMCWDYPTSSIKCSIDLTPTRSLTDLYESMNESSGTREVCYTLTGKFRGEDIVMRGCDAISSGDKCYKAGEIGVWFDTERGREDIDVKEFCTCGGEDLCNDRTFGGSCHHIVSTLLMLIPITLVVLSGY